MLKPYDRSAGADPRTLQDRVDLFTSVVQKKHGLDALQWPVSLTAGVQNVLEHGLGRDWRGWRIVDDDVGAAVFTDATATQDPKYFLVLGCDINCNVEIEVF
jgi:hypothetical protein